MADNLTKSQRSFNMSRIRSTKTAPEMEVRPIMKKLGFSFQPKRISGRPDFVNRKRKVVVFIDGCFWHKCRYHYVEPKSNLEYWKGKVKRNVERDRTIDKKLKEQGWKVLRIWEHEIKKGTFLKKLG